METGEASVRWNLLERRLHQQRAADAFALYRSNGIEPILIKGVAAEAYYPPGARRAFSDVDLAVSPEEFPAAEAVDTSGHAIDLHSGMRHLDTVEWTDLFENCIILAHAPGQIRVLRPEDHLRILSVHWLTDGGIFRERLWDIYWLVTANRGSLEWARLFDPVSRFRRRWIEVVLGLTQKHLGLDLSGTPVEAAASSVPLWVSRAVETSWQRDAQLLPLHRALTSGRVLADQLRDRIRPNPLSSVVLCEGNIDARMRLHYQATSFVRRLAPSIARVTTAAIKEIRS
jgi:hypothetical protein